LHDGIGQDLLIIHNELQRKAHSRGISSKVLQELSKSIIECINDVRQIASNLHPHQLERLGLEKAIESDVGKLAHSTGVNISVKVEPIVDLLSADAKINIYRIVQEALSNVVKHSDASAASVEIAKGERSIRVLIKDNGTGFDVKSQVSSGMSGEGFGLCSMAERVKMISGTLEIKSEPMKGTSVEVDVPLPGNADPKIAGQ
jgi:signal transduction histidine kinase